MSSPVDRSSLHNPAGQSQHSLARARKGSSTSLSSLPARLAQPSALKPPSANVQLDLSSASASDHPSLLTASRIKSSTLSPAATTSRASNRTSIVDSSEVWRSSAAKRAEKAWAVQSERALYSDAKFKKYTSIVERTLATFEGVSEWADFISFLSRLLKSVQAYPNFNVIPRKLIVAKRLAQCLNPALPSGVHQRALDVYSHIFSVIGPDGLRRDLQIWTSGLLPFYQYASTSVKPALLDLYEKHYIPLQEDLRPITRSLLLALLPGLEEETGEFFEKTLRLLDSVSRSVGRAFLLQCLWLVLITSPSVRLAALNFLGKRMPNLNQEVDPSRLVGKDVGLMVRGLSHALEDDTLLVRRNALELLVTHIRMDRPIFQRHIKTVDKVILVRAAMSVVLRRDLSLNRRLYSWLLGPEDSMEAQTGYLRSYGLELVRRALKEDFDRENGSISHSDTAERQRPYKIFVSLLDKWEIGQPLTKVLVLDAFRALSRQVTDDTDDEISTTANMLFEVVDPYLLYGQYFTALRQQLQLVVEEGQTDGPLSLGGTRGSAVELLCFMLKSFRVHDDETKQIHVPTLFASILELVRERLTRFDQDNEIQNGPLLLDTLELLKLLLDLIPGRVFGRNSPEMAGQEDGEAPDFLARADRFYASGETNAEEAAQHFRGFEDVVSSSALVELCADVTSACARLVTSSGPLARQEIFVRALDVFAELLRLVDESVNTRDSANNKLSWDVAQWATSLLAQVERSSSFAEVERTVEVLISCAMLTSARSRFDLGQGASLQTIVDRLLYYMDPDRSPYHLRSVELLWAACRVTPRHHLERVLCQRVSNPSAPARLLAMQSFGTLWRLSEDLPCEELWSPLLLVLDRLRSPDAEDRQHAETWLRANLRSYPKLVDPLLHMLLASGAVRRPDEFDLDGLRFDLMKYTKPFDQPQTLYALQTLVALSRFSGQGFARAFKTNVVSASVEKLLHPTEETSGANERRLQKSYLDVLLDESLTLLRSYPEQALRSCMRETNASVQAAAVELVQGLVQRGNLHKDRLREIERVLVECLLIATATDTIEGQNRLLHALHSVITARATASINPPGPERVFSTSSTNSDVRDESALGAEGAAGPSRSRSALTAHPLFLPMIQRGLTSQANRPILQHWSDFVLMAMPFFRSSVNTILLPINDCVCDLIRVAVADVLRSYSPGPARMTFGAELAVQSDDAICRTSDSDLTLLISMSERILLQALGEDMPQQSSSREASVTHSDLQEKGALAGAESGSGLIGYVSNVFSADHTHASSAQPGSAAGSRTRGLQNTVQTLHSLWTMTYTKLSPRDAKSPALQNLVAKVRLRSHRALERIYRTRSADVVESLLECWQQSRNAEPSGDGPRTRAVFDLLDIVAASAQIVVTYLCDVLSTRTATSGERSRKLASSFTTSDASLFAFLDAYLTRMDSQVAPQVWPVMILLVKDFVSSSTSRKMHIFPVLRVFTTLGEKLCQTSAIEDRRTRRDLQDNYVKLVDSSILIAGRSFDQSTWMRRSGKDTNDQLDLEGSGILEKDEKAAIPGVDAPGMTLIDAINEFLASRALPALRKFQVDVDKVASIVSNAVYYIVAPNFRAKSKTLEVDVHILSLVGEIVKLPGTHKAWRAAVGDLFQDNRFFTMTPVLAEQWKPIILALMVNDKERLIELIGRITSAASANIFTNRELEMLTRAFNLRRLSFVVYSGERDAFLAQLPSIQERVVDLLRSNVSELVQTEVYLCMRVLLCRFSARHLASFWPVINTELMRLFETLMDELPADESDQLQLVLSACKFLDLLLVLQTEDFQVHQWMFITDTTDVIYAPDDWMADSIMDRLSTVVSERKSSSSSAGLTPSSEVPEHVSDPFSQLSSEHDMPSRARAKRRPLLTTRRNVQRIDQLLPFFQRISLESYEAMYEVGVRAPPLSTLAGSSTGGSGGTTSAGGSTSSGAANARTDDVDWPAVEYGLIRDMFEGVQLGTVE